MPATSVVVVGGASLVRQCNVCSSVKRADGAPKHFDCRNLSAGATVKPRCTVGELKGAIGHGELAPGVRGSRGQSSGACFESKVEFGTLRDHAISRKDVARCDINAATEGRVTVVVELQTARSRPGKVDSQSAPSITGAVVGTSNGLITAKLNAVITGFSRVAQGRLRVDLQDTVREVQTCDGIISIENQGTKTALHEEVSAINHTGRILSQGETSTDVKPTVAPLNMIVACCGERVFPDSDTGVDHVDEAGVAPVGVLVDADQTTRDGCGATVSIVAGEENCAGTRLDEMIGGAALTINDAAISINVACVVGCRARLVHTKEDLAHHPRGSWCKADRSREA